MSERFKIMAQQLEAKKMALGELDDLGNGGSEIVQPAALQKWIAEQIEYLKTTSSQLMVRISWNPGVNDRQILIK